MILKEATGPAVPTLPLAEFTEHLRLGYGFADDGSQDQALERYLRAAASVVETQIAQALIIRRFVLSVSEWPRDGQLVFPVAPVTALISVRFVGATASTDLSTDAFVVSADTARPRLSRIGGGALPQIPNGYKAEITFDAGHASDWSGVPDALRQAVTLLAAGYYDVRTPSDSPQSTLPGSVEALLSPYRARRL